MILCDYCTKIIDPLTINLAVNNPEFDLHAECHEPFMADLKEHIKQKRAQREQEAKP